MINWIIENKTWLFSGVLVAIIGGVFAFIRLILTKKQQASSNSMIKQKQKSGKNSTNIQVSGNLTINEGVKNNVDESKNRK